MPLANGDPRKTRRWRRVRLEVLRHARRCEAPGCQGPPLDFDAPPLSRWAPSVDHIVPISHGGRPFALENLRPVHCGCNSVLSNQSRKSKPAPAKPTRATWW